MKTKSKIIGYEDQPIHSLQWIHRDQLTANDWNPNKQAPPETDLLAISILEDGWTQPIVALDCGDDGIYTIIDGFHRHYVSERPEIMEMTDGYLPVVVLKAEDENHKRMSTIRHNRARGTHTVLAMAEIVKEMLEEGVKADEICERLQMERDEVERLALRVGIPLTDDIKGKDFDKGWTPE